MIFDFFATLIIADDKPNFYRRLNVLSVILWIKKTLSLDGFSFHDPTSSQSCFVAYKMSIQMLFIHLSVDTHSSSVCWGLSHEKVCLFWENDTNHLSNPEKREKKVVEDGNEKV